MLESVVLCLNMLFPIPFLGPSSRTEALTPFLSEESPLDLSAALQGCQVDVRRKRNKKKLRSSRRQEEVKKSTEDIF